MSDKRVEQNQSSRRKLLKNALGGTIIGGAAASTPWVKPVVESVVLPAHAATTDSGGDPGSGINNLGPYFGSVDSLLVADAEGSADSKSLLSEVGDMLVPQAEAVTEVIAQPVPINRTYLCVTMTSENGFNAKLAWYRSLYQTKSDGTKVLFDAYELYEGNGTLGVVTALASTCGNEPINTIISNPTETEVGVQMFMQNTTIPASPCALPETGCLGREAVMCEQELACETI